MIVALHAGAARSANGLLLVLEEQYQGSCSSVGLYWVYKSLCWQLKLWGVGFWREVPLRDK